MFIGQASAIGLTINIPILIRSLADNRFFLDTDEISSKMAPVLRVALAGIADDNILTIAVESESYRLNWWDNDKVR
jgi:exoribonuclease II